MIKGYIIWGYSILGINAMRFIEEKGNCVYGFADNNIEKQKYFVNGVKILSIDDLKIMNRDEYIVVIAIKRYFDVASQLRDIGWQADSYFDGTSLKQIGKAMCFSDINASEPLYLYAGDICDDVHLNQRNLVGVSINKSDSKHIKHDITKKFELPDNCVARFEAEDVLEHIEIGLLPDVFKEIYRVLKKGAHMRISLPDYNSPRLNAISMKDTHGNIVFDASGGGNFVNNSVVRGGHVWFPRYDIVCKLIETSPFNQVNFLCYFDEDKKLHKNDFSYEGGYVKRIPESGGDEKTIYSMLIDCYK